jgi:hypothetical protein
MHDGYEDEPDDQQGAVAVADKDSPDTALLPKAFFASKELEPGATCKVRVEHVYDDEVAVSYVAHEGDDASEPADTMETPTLPTDEGY